MAVGKLQSPVVLYLSAVATFSALHVVLFLVGSKYLHNSPICPTCVGLIGIETEWLANHICYLMILPADTFIYLLGSFFYLCSQLLPVPFWSHSPWFLHSSVSFSTVWILILISLSFCVNCTCFRFTLLELGASRFKWKGANCKGFLAQLKEATFFLPPSQPNNFQLIWGQSSADLTLQTSAQLGRLISAKELAFQGMPKAYLLTQAFAFQIVRKTLDLTFTVDLTFKA